jgi:hypothetical protein
VSDQHQLAEKLIEDIDFAMESVSPNLEVPVGDPCRLDYTGRPDIDTDRLINELNAVNWQTSRPLYEDKTQVAYYNSVVDGETWDKYTLKVTRSRFWFAPREEYELSVNRATALLKAVEKAVNTELKEATHD